MMIHQIVHYLEIASILLCLAAVFGHVVRHKKDRDEQCNPERKPESCSTKASSFISPR